VECTIAITFTPAAVGTSVGALTITDNSPGSPHSVPLSGKGVVGFAIAADNATVSLIQGTATTEFVIRATTQYGFTGNVNLACSGRAPTDCVFEPAAIAPGQSSKLTVRNLGAMSAGSLEMVVNGTYGVQTASVPLVIVITDFAVSASPPSATVTAGMSTAYTVALSPFNGFHDRVELSCAGTPPTASCSLEPASLTLDGSGPASAKLTLKTNAHAAGLPRPGHPRFLPSPGDFPLALHLLMAFLLLTAFLRGLRMQWRLWRMASCVVALLVLILPWSACGGGGGGGSAVPAPTGGTPRGTYTLTVTATITANGPNPLSHSTAVKVTVE
jgi:hypothetical protein